jgi:hypothetical protein
MTHPKCHCGNDMACEWPNCDAGPVEQEKKQLRDMLRMIAQAHEKASKPYLDRLAALESLKMPSFRISYEEAVKAGFIKKEET